MSHISPGLAVSIVSHNHGLMVWELVEQICLFDEVTKILLRLIFPN
jgi:hypothetical protein